METATFGAGCFWGVEHTFRQIEGVVEATSGYMGGDLESPSYEAVCSDRTGHAEVVQIQYDPQMVSYEQLLETFWACHDPTTLNRQGEDVGTQYRSVIFWHTPYQKDAAEKSKELIDHSDRFEQPIVTEITPAATFYPAEEYHQRYFEKNGITQCPVDGGCPVNIEKKSSK